MRIQAINSTSYKPVFKQSEGDSRVPDRAVTVQEMLKIEDEIMRHIDEKFKMQNVLLGRTLYNMADLVHVHNSNARLSETHDAARKLYMGND